MGHEGQQLRRLEWERLVDVLDRTSRAECEVVGEMGRGTAMQALLRQPSKWRECIFVQSGR